MIFATEKRVCGNFQDKGGVFLYFVASNFSVSHVFGFPHLEDSLTNYWLRIAWLTSWSWSTKMVWDLVWLKKTGYVCPRPIAKTPGPHKFCLSSHLPRTASTLLKTAWLTSCLLVLINSVGHGQSSPRVHGSRLCHPAHQVVKGFDIFIKEK